MTSSTWACHVCTLENPARHKRCEACEARRAVGESLQSPSQSQSSSVRSWLSRRRKRKRPQQSTVRVKIRLDGNEVWEPREARMPPPGAGNFRDDGETVSEKRDSDETTQSMMTDSFTDTCADGHWTATDACGKGSPKISTTLEADCTFAMETTYCRKEPRSNDGMNRCAASSPGFEHEIAPNKHGRANNAQISNKPPFSPPHYSRDSSMVVSDPQHKDISSHKDVSSFSACYDEDTVDTSSSSQDGCTVEIGFSQLMSQQQSGFLYTQMTQSEAEFNSFPGSAIGKGKGSSERTKANVTTHGYTRKQEESYGNPENATERAQSNVEPDFLMNEANAPIDAEQSPNMPSRPMLDRIGNGSRIQVTKESLQKADELLRKESTPTCFAQCTFQTAGKGAVISVTEESLSRATALLQDASAEVDSLAPLRDFSSTSTSCQPEALFHTAGKQSAISVSEDSMARATALLQNASVPAVDVDRKESSQATSSFSASAPQFASAFRAAGKKVIVSVTEDSRTWANTLLQDATAADEPKIYSIPVASGPQPVAAFQTAGTGSLISIKDESMERATTLLKGTMAANSENEPLSTSPDLSSAPRSFSQQGAMFQCTGEGNVISVSEDSMAWVTALLQKASPTIDVDRKATTQALSSRSTRAPQYAVAFHTADKKSVISVTEDGMARANTLLQDATTIDVEPSPQPRLLPVAKNSQLAVVFQSAGKASVISVQEETTTRATALLQDKAVATSEVTTYSLSRDLSSSPTTLPHPGSIFQTAGKGTMISVSDVSMERATALLQDSSVILDKARTNELSQEVSSVSTNVPHFAAMFHTAGKKNVVSVTEDGIKRAKALLQNERATDVEPVPKMGSSPVANGPVAMFQTAGKGGAISLLQEESKALATALLRDKSVATGEVDTYLLSRELSSAPTTLSQSRSMFQTAGKGTVISVSDDSMERATALLQDSSVAIAEAGTKKSSAALSISASTSAPQFTATFHTAGKNAVVSVTDDGLVHASALLQERTAADVEQASHICLSSVANGSQSAIKFQTAGKGSVISVKKESMAWATTLLQDKSACSAQADPKKPPQDLSPSWQSCSPRAVVFQAAGKGNILEDRLEPAKVVLQKTSPADDSTNMIESSQDAAGMSRPVALFQTTGKGTVVSVTDDSIMTANTLLHDAATTDVDDLAQPSGATSYPELVASFQSAGKGSVISTANERMAWGKALLEDIPDSGFEADLNEPPQELSSVETIYSRSAAFLQTDGEGSVVSVLEESLTLGSKVLHDSLTANKDETTTRPYQGGDIMWSSSASPVKKRTRIDTFNECRAKAADEDTKECNTRFAKTSCDYILETDESTQPVPPETPLLLYRHEQLESLHHKETPMAIRSAAFSLTPQSQHNRGNLVPRRQQAFDASPETYFESPDDVHPEPYTNLANQATPASRLLVSKTTKRRASLSQPTLANPTFTPKQTPAEITSAAVTMSVDPKNPYLRNRHNNPNSSPNLKDAYSPVPIDFRHSDGSFRGKVISPSSISYAESVLPRGPGESGNELKKLPVSAHSGGSTLLDSRTKKKVVTWSEDTVKSDLVPTRTTLLNFAAEYGKMNDCISVGLNAGIHPVTLAVDSNNAARIRFDAESELPCSFFGQACPPHCTIVGSVKDLRASLLSRSCEEKKLVDKWISNHYRWIVWKLASMERRFASSLAQSYLTYEHVITQMKKRYERELKGGERSALRKVLNRDVAANSMIILCVCQTLRPIKGEGTDTKNSKHDECYVELTDGWYSIRGVLDASLSAHVRNRKIKAGTKLLICNGRLEGSEDGVDPLDPSYSCSGQNCSVALYLSANGTRLANWDAKMGFVKPSQYIRSTRGSLLVRSISHVIPGGGNVPLIDVIVCRLYPRMFLERKGMSNPSDSIEGHNRKSPVISEAQECRNRMDFEKKRQQAIERLSETVQNECAKEVDEMAPELWKSLMKNRYPCDFYEQLSRCDQVVVDRWKEKRDTVLRDMAQKVIEESLDGDAAMFRESTPFIRVFVKSYNPCNKENGTEEPVCEGALLTIWNPSEQQLGLLWEGHVVRLRNLLVRATKHEGLMQLTAGAKTQMETISSSPLLPSQLASLGYSNRVFAKLFRVHTIAKKLSANLLPSSPAPEVDTAAILLRVSQEGNTEERELIYMTDETGLVLRVERDRTSYQDDSFISRSKSAWQNAENPTSVAFRDLRITHFDSAENCAVAVYTQTSCVASKTPRFSELLKWAKSPSGRCFLRRLAACMDSGIPLNQPASNQTAIATGYIAGFCIPERSNNSHLEIKVDCGMAELLVWDFPFFLLDDALSLCNIAPEPVSLEREVDEMYAKLKVLGKIFGARGLLLVFSLRRKSNMACEDGKYEVRKVKVADSNALAHVYVTTVKEAEQERKGRLEKQKK